MKKKIFGVLIIFIIGFILGFVVRGVELPQNDDIEKNELYAIKEEDIGNYVKKIDDITVENWKEYIMVDVWEGDSKNSFGDVISTTKCSYIRVKDNIYFKRDDVSLEIKFKEGLSYDNELMIITPYKFDINFEMMSGLYSIKDQDPDVKVNTTLFTMDDIVECSRAKGALYSIEIPDDYFTEGGFMRVLEENGMYEIIHKNDIETLIDYLN